MIEGLDTTASNPWVAIDVARVSSKPELPLELGTHGKRHFDGRKILDAYEADGRRAEVLDCDALDGPCRLMRVTLAPCPTKKSPFDFGLWPIVRVPEAHATDHCRGRLLDYRIRTVAAKLPMPDHAGHGAPGLALGKGSTKSEPGALRIGIVFVQDTPVFSFELAQHEPLGIEGERNCHRGSWCLPFDMSGAATRAKRPLAIRRRGAGDLHGAAAKARLSPEHAAGPGLTSQAMATETLRNVAALKPVSRVS